MKFLLATHGHFASGLKSSVEILSGTCDRLVSIDAYVDEQGFESQLERFLNTCSTEEQVILLSDIYGGSVNQILYRHLGDLPKMKLICGISLPLVMELVLGSVEEYSDEQLEAIVQMARMGMKLIACREESGTNQADDDFF